MKKYIWMKVDLNGNEDVLAVAESQKELAQLCGVKESSIRETLSRAKRRGWRCCYVKVEDDEENL